MPSSLQLFLRTFGLPAVSIFEAKNEDHRARISIHTEVSGVRSSLWVTTVFVTQIAAIRNMGSGPFESLAQFKDRNLLT